MKNLSAISIACVAAALLCIIALAKLPYGYYSFLRLVVCGVGVAAGVVLVKRGDPKTALLGWALAILYNPLFKVPLQREAWEVANVVTAGVLGYLAFVCRNTAATVIEPLDAGCPGGC
ncbi:MAG: hypothetical protein IT435_10795 [Phycisphaerales bacterium]|nr:hypothetical protein [Phycisphaerales bacterium]